MPQLVYGADMGIGYEGQIASDRLRDVVTRYSESAMKPGRVVGAGTAPEGVVLGGDGTGIGVLVRKVDIIGDSSDELEYPDNKPVPVMTQGEIYIKFATAVTFGDALRYVDATGVIEVGAAVGGTSTAFPTGSKCLQTNSAAGVAKIFIGPGPFGS
jgi:hypothetical protein